MKRILGFLITFVMSFGYIVFADVDTTVEVIGETKLKAGEKTEITLNIKNIDRLYGAQLDFYYNAEDIKVISMNQAGIFDEQSDDGKFESQTTDFDESGKAIYYYVYMGEFEGVSGDNGLVKLEIEAKKDCELSYDEESMQVMLIRKNAEDTPEEIPFRFIGSKKDEVIVKPDIEYDIPEDSTANENVDSSASSSDSDENKDANSSRDDNESNENEDKSSEEQNDNNNEQNDDGDESQNNQSGGSLENEDVEKGNNLGIIILGVVILSGALLGFFSVKKRR